MVDKPERELYNIAEAADSLSESAQGLTKVMLDLNDSRLWTIISRVSSGILPGFWSIQNKIRAVTDIVAMNQKSITEQQEKMIENMKTIQKLGKQADLVMDLDIFDEKTMAKFSSLTDNMPTNIVTGMYKRIGGQVEGFRHLEQAILGKEAENQEERKEVLQAMKELIEPQRKRILDRQEEVRKAREFQKAFKEELDDLGIDPKKNKFRAFLIRQRMKIQRFLKIFTAENIKNFFKNASMLFLKVVLFVTLFITFTFFIYRAIKDNTIFFGWLKKQLSSAFGWFMGSLRWIVEGIGLLVEGFREGNILKVFLGIGKIFAGILGAVLIPIVAGIGGVILAAVGLMYGGFIEYAKSSERDAKMFGAAFLQFVGWFAAIVAAVLYLFTPAGWLTIAGVLAVAIVSLIGSTFLGKRSTGGVVNEGMTLVGEKGPELVSLPAGSRVYTNQQSRSMGGNTVINVNVSGRVGASDAEIKDIANKVAREINLRMNRTATTGARF